MVSSGSLRPSLLHPLERRALSFEVIAPAHRHPPLMVQLDERWQKRSGRGQALERCIIQTRFVGEATVEIKSPETTKTRQMRKLGGRKLDPVEDELLQ